MSQYYVVAVTHAWANSSGYGFETTLPSRNAWDSRDAAISEGFRVCGTDDFNIVKIRNGKAIAVYWMNEDLNEDAAVLEKLTELAEGPQR